MPIFLASRYLAVLNPECHWNEASFFFWLFTLIFLIPCLKVCCTSQQDVMGNTWDTRLSKYPMVRKARLKPTWRPQGLAASKVHQQWMWMGEGEWDWTMSQSSEPDAEGCYLETSCPAKETSRVQASSWTLVVSVGSWHQPLRPHMAICIRPDLST